MTTAFSSLPPEPVAGRPGVFRLRLPAWRPTNLRIGAPGRARTHRRLVPADVRGEISVLLHAPASAVGRVVGSDGAPAAGATIYWWPPQRLVGRGRTFTGEDGRFRIQGAEPGEVRLRISRLGEERCDLDTMAVIEGGGTDLGDFRLPPVAILRGTVRNGAGRRLGAVRIEVVRGTERLIQTLSSGSGEYELLLPAVPRCTLVATHTGCAPAVVRNLWLPDGGRLDLRLPPERSVIVAPANVPHPDWTLEVDVYLPGIDRPLRADENWFRESPAGPSIRRVGGLPEGPVTLRLRCWDPWGIGKEEWEFVLHPPAGAPLRLEPNLAHPR